MKKTAHILKNFEPGGVEKWLVDITKINKFKGNKIDFHFLLQSSNSGFFSSEIKSNGGKIHHIIYSRYNFFIYFIKLFIFFKKNNFDVVHSHVYHFSGFILLIAYLAGVPIRIAHCHNEKKDINNSLLKKIYIKICTKLINVFSTKKIAVSENSAILFYKNLEDVLIIPCGILFDESENTIQKKSNNKPIHLLSVASFTYQKNHIFMIKIAIQLKLENIKFKFFWIGAGNLTSEIKNNIIKNDLSKEIVVLGKRNDVQKVMSCCDIFIFPSHYEGLGLAAVESQYYGLTTIVNESLPTELNNSDYIFRLPITDMAVNDWVNIIKHHQKPSCEQICKTKNKIKSSPLNAYNNFEKISNIYFK